MKTKIKKWGNSLGLRLPKIVLESMGILEDSEIQISLGEGQMFLRPINREASFKLKDLVKKISKNNIHEKIDWGKKVGKEVW